MEPSWGHLEGFGRHLGASWEHLVAILKPYAKNIEKSLIFIVFLMLFEPPPSGPKPGERKNGKQRLFVCSCCECWAMCEETLRIWRHSGYASEAMLAPCCMTCRHSYAVMGMLASSWDHLCFCMQSHSYWFYFDLLRVPSARFARSGVEEISD